MAHVGQLVGHHLALLVARELGQQVVVQDHPLGRAQAGDVGVGGGGAPAGVDLVHLPHLHAGSTRQLQHVGACRAGGQRLEAVEQRVEHDRPRVQEARRNDHGQRRRRCPPVARPAAHQTPARSRRPPRPSPRRWRWTWPRPPPTPATTGWPGRRRSPAGAPAPTEAAKPTPAPATGMHRRRAPPSTGRRQERRSSRGARRASDRQQTALQRELARRIWPARGGGSRGRARSARR